MEERFFFTQTSRKGKHLLNQWRMIFGNLISRRRMSAREMEALFIVFKEHRFKMSNRVILTEYAPYLSLAMFVELNGLQAVKLINKAVIDNKLLFAIYAKRLVLMLAFALLQELRHQEVRVTQQCRNTPQGRSHLSIKCSTAVAYKKIRIMYLAQLQHVCKCIMGLYGKVWSKHIVLTQENIFESPGRNTTATGKEPMQEYNCLHCFVIASHSPR